MGEVGVEGGVGGGWGRGVYDYHELLSLYIINCVLMEKIFVM